VCDIKKQSLVNTGDQSWDSLGEYVEARSIPEITSWDSLYTYQKISNQIKQSNSEFQKLFILDRRYGCFTGYRIVAAPAVTALLWLPPPHEDEVITVMTRVGMTGAGVVSHNGEVIARVNQAIIIGRLWRWRTWRGRSGLGRLRSVTDLECLFSNGWLAS